MQQEFLKARIIAQRSLAANIEKLNGHSYLTAGRNQFRSLWTRDFCFSIPALKSMGREDVIHDHIQLLLELRRADGLIPRVVDSKSPRRRVVRACISHLTRGLVQATEMDSNLQPEFVDEHGTEALDSNLLLLPHLNDEKVRREVLSYVEKRRMTDSGFLEQPPFSDWQDSAKRTGVSFFIQLLLWRVLNDEKLRFDLHNEFKISDYNLFRSLKGRDLISLEAHLLGIEWGFFQETKVVYEALKKSPLWLLSPSRMPGFASYPSYHKHELSLAVRIANMEEYHGRLHWSWLMAKAARVAHYMKDFDEARKIAYQLARNLIRDDMVSEIYDSRNDFEPVQTWLYKSEAPFSWGASECLLLFQELTSSSAN